MAIGIAYPYTINRFVAINQTIKLPWALACPLVPQYPEMLHAYTCLMCPATLQISPQAQQQKNIAIMPSLTSMSKVKCEEDG